MVNKTTSFKKAKGQMGSFKKGSGKRVVPPEKKTKSGSKLDTECFYCKEKGHWKCNNTKYLADKKDGIIKGIFDIHVMMFTLLALVVVLRYMILVQLLIFVTRNMTCGIDGSWQGTR
jgi:hypothetical protein